MSSRLVSLALATLTATLLAACAGTTADAPATPVPSHPTAPAPTPVPTPVVAPTPTPTINAGDVEGGAGPALSIEFPGDDMLLVSLQDRHAKAWRLVVAGTGDTAHDSLEIVVETGDIEPVITATEIQQGEVVGVMDLSGYLDGTAAAGGCHRTLPVCIDSSSFRLPADDDGLFAVRLLLPEPAAHLVLTGGSATWPGEPFVLGPWTDTEPFTWAGAG